MFEITVAIGSTVHCAGERKRTGEKEDGREGGGRRREKREGKRRNKS